MQEARPVGGIQSQLGQGFAFAWQRESQGLTLLTDDARGGQLEMLGVFTVLAQVELGGEMSRPLRKFKRGRNWLGDCGGLCAGDELVGESVGHGQQMASDGWRQAVEGDPEFRCRQAAFDGFDGVNLPALIGQKA
uniref:Uncharacterized protein n=1 Tax=Populus trichocarpa TaxID=3694 RepID=A0A2K1QFC4_POPTR